MFASFSDNLRMSILELFNNKLRAFLTVLGITIGIGAVVLLLSLGQSVQDYIAAQFESLGTNTIRISASPDSNGRHRPAHHQSGRHAQGPERLSVVRSVMPEVTGNYFVAVREQ